MAAHPGPNVPHATPRKQALKYAQGDHFEGAISYDPAAGTPSSQSGGAYDAGREHAAHKHSGKPDGQPLPLNEMPKAADPKPFNLGPQAPGQRE